MTALANISALFRPEATASSRVGPIGIDFGLEAIHLVQLESAGDRPLELRARASVAYDGPRREILEDPTKLRALLKRALGADQFRGRKAVVAVPSGMFRTMSINYRSAPGKEREAAAIIDVMRDRLDGDLTDYVLDYLPVNSRSNEDERLALVAVSDRQSIVDFLESARKARLDVQALEIGPVAIGRMVGVLSLAGDSDNVLIINSGRRASYLTLISGNDLLFDQEVAFGENSLVQRAAEALDLPEHMARDLIAKSGVLSSGSDQHDPEQLLGAESDGTMAQILKPQFMKLVEEIRRVCLYAAAETRGGAVARIYLLGSIARWPGSDELLRSLIGTEVTKISDPLALFPAAGKTEHQSEQTAAEIVVATGAALRGMQHHV